MSNSNVEKGKLLENHIADRIRELGIDPKAYRSHGSGNGNREKSDIWTNMMVFGRQVGIEAKNHAVVRIREWWEQTMKLESLGYEPVLAFKFRGEGVENTKVVIFLDTFLELVRAQNWKAKELKNSNDIAALAQQLRNIADELSTS